VFDNDTDSMSSLYHTFSTPICVFRLMSLYRFCSNTSNEHSDMCTSSIVSVSQSSKIWLLVNTRPTLSWHRRQQIWWKFETNYRI